MREINFGTLVTVRLIEGVCLIQCPLNPFAPGDFAEKHVLKVLEWFSGHCPAMRS